MSISAKQDLFDLQLRNNNYENTIAKEVQKFQNGEKLNLRMTGHEGRSLEVRTSNQMLIVTYHSSEKTGFVRTYKKQGSTLIKEEESLDELFKNATSFVANHSKGATSTTSLLYKAKK